MFLDLDPSVEATLNRVAEFYNITPERYCEVILTRAFDELVSTCPNAAHLVELR